MGSDKWRRQQTVREATNWISRIESGDTECMRSFLAWLERGEQHHDAVREIIRLTYALRRLSFAEWDDVLVNVRKRPSNVVALHPEAPQARPPRRSFRIFGAAISAFAIVVVGGFFLATGHSVDVYRTAKGETRLLALADGSKVHLNSSTEIRVHFHRHARKVDLVKGEALFDVTHDATRPFKVMNRGATAQALGTQFDVRLDGDELRVAVTRGRVAVGADVSAAGWPRVVIGESEIAVLNVTHGDRVADVHVLRDSERERVLSWTGFIDLNNIPLSEAVVRFNAANTTQLVLDDPEIADLRLGGRFCLVDPISFVDTLPFIAQVVVVRGPDDPGRIHLKKKAADPSKIRASSPSIGTLRVTRAVFDSDALMEYPTTQASKESKVRRMIGKRTQWQRPAET